MPGENHTADRKKLTVRLSYDDGQTWPIARLIHAGPAAYSVPARLPDGMIGLLYECGEQHRYECIRFSRFSMKWLAGGRSKA